jgi:DNA invertase Pin-like site-specific DNA recombinase
MQSKNFGYARVSTMHQNSDRQIQALEDYGINSRDIIVDKQSGKDFNRVGYLSLKENILREGDTLVIKELDRLGRNKEQIKGELEYYKRAGIRVKILDIPTTLIECEGQEWVVDMVSNILIEVLASVAEEERMKNHQRQSEGIAVAKEKGVCFGRPKLVKPEGFDEMFQRVEAGEIKAVDLMRELGLKKTSYYKLRSELLAERRA